MGNWGFNPTYRGYFTPFTAGKGPPCSNLRLVVSNGVLSVGQAFFNFLFFGIPPKHLREKCHESGGILKTHKLSAGELFKKTSANILHTIKSDFFIRASPFKISAISKPLHTTNGSQLDTQNQPEFPCSFRAQS